MTRQKKKQRGTEGYLSTVSEALREYEKEILRRVEAQAAVTAIDKTLASIREQLLHLAGGAQPTASTPSRTKRTKAPKKAKAAEKTGGGMDARLADQDPRIQRSVGAAMKALRDLGGSAHRDDIAKRLGVSANAVDLRMVRGVKLGMIKRLGKGAYTVR